MSTPYVKLLNFQSTVSAIAFVIPSNLSFM